MDYDLNSTLGQMRQLDTTGNIIPHSWYKAITFESGKPDLLGMMILAEIVYWYRPTEIRDQYTGKLIEYRKKFKGDMLQRNYNSFATQFGVSPRQAMDAVKRLEQKGLLIKEVRDIQTKTTTLGNVLFIAPNIETLLSLQIQTTKVNSKDPEESDDDPPYTFERISSHDQTYKLMQSKVEAPTFKRSTYTENTTEISPEITHDKKTAAKPIGASIEKKSVDAAAGLMMKSDDQREDENRFPQMLIGKALTRLQEELVSKMAQEMVKQNRHADAKKLAEEIIFALLCSNSFTQAGNDFFKKLNTIKKCIREGRWTRPAKLVEKEAKKSITLEQSNKRREQELVGECAHWKYVSDLFQEKNKLDQVQMAKEQHQKALAILKNFQEAQARWKGASQGEAA